jgi:hypothetical protein
MNAHVRSSQIEFWALDRLRLYARNAKTHDADQVARIAASMAEFAWTVPAPRRRRRCSSAVPTCGNLDSAKLTDVFAIADVGTRGHRGHSCHRPAKRVRTENADSLGTENLVQRSGADVVHRRTRIAL